MPYGDFFPSSAAANPTESVVRLIAGGVLTSTCLLISTGNGGVLADNLSVEEFLAAKKPRWPTEDPRL